MSEVISFRLNPSNPREALALEILRNKQKGGFSSRRVLTDALIGMETIKDQINIDEFNTALENLKRLLEKLNSDNHELNQSMLSHPIVAAALEDNFLN